MGGISLYVLQLVKEGGDEYKKTENDRTPTKRYFAGGFRVTSSWIPFACCNEDYIPETFVVYCTMQ